MVLLSFLLVLSAAVTLVIGLVGTGLGLIYLSIACSLGAGIVLALAVMRSRPSTELAAAGPAPLPVNDPHPFSTAPTAPTAPRTVVAGPVDAGERIRVFADPDPVAEVDVEPAAEDVFAPAADSWDVADDEWGDDAFPIADYDSLRASQIVPLLAELDPDELETVRQREVDVKGGRVSILNRIDALLGRTVAAKKAPAKRAASGSTSTPKRTAAAAKSAAPAKKATAVPAKKTAATTKKAATGSTSASKKAAGAAKKTTKRL